MPGSVSSRSSSSSSSSSSGSGKSIKFRERRFPDTPAVNTLLYFTGRHPKKVKGVRVYQTTWDDGFDDRSVHSGWSGSSWGGSRVKTQIYLLETRGGSYWDGYAEKSSSSSSGRNSRASRPGGGNRDPWKGKGGGGGGGGRARPAQVDDDESDDDGSVHSFAPPPAHPQMHPGGGMPRPPMMGRPPMPPMGAFPPQGAFQPGFGPPPQGFPGGPPAGFPPGGFPPRATPVPGPQPRPPGGGQFVRDANNIQFFDADA